MTHVDSSRARAKLESYLASARERSAPALRRIMNEVPRDRILRSNLFDFDVNDGNEVTYLAPGQDRASVHSNALTQMAGVGDVPMSYVRSLQEVNAPWARQQLASTLNTHFCHRPEGTRYLTRTVDGQTRALLSDSFKRIDGRPGLNAIAEVATQMGALVTDAVATDTRVSVRLVSPHVHEISPGEFVILGFAWNNSDYGRGASDLREFIMRLLCLNGAMGESALRQIHLGRKMDDGIDYRESTVKLISAAEIASLKDAARTVLGDRTVRNTVARLTALATEAIDPKAKAADLKKRVGKGLAEQVAEAYNRPDVEDLPAGNTAWRWSNALSWVAGHTSDAETRIDLEREAGAALKRAA